MSAFLPGKKLIYKSKDCETASPKYPNCTFIGFEGMFCAKIEFNGKTEIVELIELEVPKSSCLKGIITRIKKIFK